MADFSDSLLELDKASGRNAFQGVYGELYRRFKIPSYRELPAARFDEAMRFLGDWYASLVEIENGRFKNGR